LGQGTFSSVWLAEDLSPTSLNVKIKSSLSTTSSLMRRLRGGVSGTRPGGASASSSAGKTGDSVPAPVAMGRNGTLMPSPAPSRLVAVKLTSRGERARERDRTRVSFVREVEVMKHISHPNITPLLSHLTTRTHHVLVLPYLPGGDLLGLVNDEVSWNYLSERTLRRIFAELCKAVGWLHGVGLVHRDIKLESKYQLLDITYDALTSIPRPSLPTSSQPLIKLTDFGLSRFIDPAKPLLTTRCGSEAYAAPELVSESAGGYDARETDAWACGVVLYALVARRLPFGEGPGETLGGGRISGEAGGERSFSPMQRRQWLMKIARGEWHWPEAENESRPSSVAGSELRGHDLVHSSGAKRAVGRLLVRDPSRRARVKDLWDDEWVQ
ncbi:kinase-like protein, partial [Lentinula raphanica]